MTYSIINAAVVLNVWSGCQNALAGSPEAVVFVTNYLQRGSVDTEPREEELVDTVSLYAAPGEYEPATVAIRALSDLKSVSVTLADDLRNETGTVIPASAVDVRLVDPFESWTKNKIDAYLLSQKNVDIPAGTTRRFWITIHIPADATPGLYRTQLLVAKRATQLGPDLGRPDSLGVLTYQVDVLPVNLLSAKETGMAFFMFNDTEYYHQLSPDLVTEEFQTRVFEDMREHGMTTTTAYIVPVVDGAFTLTGHDDKHLSFEKTMRMLKKTDLMAPGLPLIWIWGGNFGPEVWGGVLEEARKNDWSEIVFYVSDEPGDPERARGVRESMKTINAFRQKNPHYNLRLTTALGSSRGIQVVGHYYDLWIGCMAQRIGESGVIADAEMQRKELWVYDCMAAPVDAETDRYFFGVWAWVSGVTGCAHWTYFAQDHLSYVYPTKDELIPSIGWEAVREGIDDYRYLYTLKTWVEKARAAGRPDLTGNADKLFADVQNMVTMDNYGKAYHQAATLTTAELNTAYHRPRVEPDSSINAYDRMRLRVANEIARISKSLQK